MHPKSIIEHFCLGLCMIMFLQLSSFAQDYRYYYAEIESQDSNEYAYQYGVFDYNEELHLTKQEANSEWDQQTFLFQLREKLEALPDDQKNIFIYIHGMWGHKSWYLNEVAQAFDTDILKGKDHPFGIVINLVWHSGMNYHDNVSHAYKVGKFYAPLVQTIANLGAHNVKVLCHSMGNRVFQGIISEMDPLVDGVPIFSEVYMVAADLEENIFSASMPMESISTFTKKCLVYVHNNDRSLGISQNLNKNNRLGLDGGKSTCANDTTIWVIDVSTIDDIEGIAPAISNHRYFYTSPSVRKDLYNSILGQRSPNRIVLDHPHRVKLESFKN